MPFLPWSQATNLENRAQICFLLSWKHCRGTCQVHHDCFLRYSILLRDTCKESRELLNQTVHRRNPKDLFSFCPYKEAFGRLHLTAPLFSAALSLSPSRVHVTVCGSPPVGHCSASASPLTLVAPLWFLPHIELSFFHFLGPPRFWVPPPLVFFSAWCVLENQRRPRLVWFMPSN